MKTIVHIGLGKTGSTFLQDEIFNKISNINYLGKKTGEYQKWLINLHYLDDYIFNKEQKDISREILNLLDEEKINLISSETFTRPGGEIFSQAKRIKNIFDDAKILLVLREPIDAILSFYKYNVSQGNITSKLSNSIDITRTPMVFYKRKPIYLPDFYYDEIINIYTDFFGSENICILKYEDLKNNPSEFFTELSTFIEIELDINDIKEKLNIKVNSSPSEDTINTLRARTLYKKLKEEFPKSTIKLEDIKVENNLIMSEKLRIKLVENLKGKCFGYY